MFLHFHGKYNMILFVLEIFNHIQIKQLILFVFFDFLQFNNIKKKIQTHISFTIFSPVLTCLQCQHKSKLTKQNLNNSKIHSQNITVTAGKLSGICGNTGGAWTSRTTATGGAWTHVPSLAKTSKLVDRDRLLLLFPFIPAVHLPVTCKATQQHKQYFTFVFLFSFRSAIISLR